MASPHPEVGTGPAAVGHHVVEIVVGGRRYGLPLESVERLHRMVEITPVPDAAPLVLGVVDVAGIALPVLDMRRRLGHGPSPCRLDDRLVVLCHDGWRALVPVEEVVGVLPLTAGRLAPAPAPAGPDTLATAVLEHDGKLCILLDPGLLFPPEIWSGRGTADTVAGGGAGEH